VKPSEAAALADLIYRQAEGRSLNEELRSAVASQIGALQFSSLRVFPGSFAQDPRLPSSYYLAVDAIAASHDLPLLLQFVSAVEAADSLFADASLIARVRPAGEREVIINAIPFRSTDRSAIRAFAHQVDRAFLPRPQGAQPAIAVGNRHPEISLPAVFDAFRTLLKAHGVNLASTVQLSATREMTLERFLPDRDGENPTAAGHTRVSIAHLFDAGLWAAVRAGWREGYNAEADHFIVTGDNPEQISRSIEMVKESIREAAGYTKFTTDTSRLFELQADTRHPRAWTDADVEDRFKTLFSDADQRWIIGEFSQTFNTAEQTYTIDRAAVLRMAVKFGRSLQINEELYDYIREAKASAGVRRAFDFEPSIDEAETLTTPEELFFYMHWLKSRGRPAQLVPPNLGFKKRQAYPIALETSESAGVGLRDYASHKMWPELLPRVEQKYRGRSLDELAARISELAAVARHFDGTLSIHSGSGKQAEVLEQIGKATSNRVNYKISGELQLQLFDVLYEQPADSPWRGLYERMIDRCNDFAAHGAFGEESALAAHYRDLGRGSYLGDPSRGRVNGNLFLVFWIGNIVGSRDTQAPDGDHRFFKEKLDELPRELIAEARRRNHDYIVWLARQLMSWPA
jgi:hypothetical protein